MVREFAVPPNIYALEHTHEEEESDEDGREISVDELSEDDRPFHEIECLGHVHHTAEDITTISDEVVNCLNDNPRAHVCRTLGLVGELEIIETKSDTEQKDNNPVNDLQYKAAYRDAPIIFARTDICQFILDYRNQSSQK